MVAASKKSGEAIRLFMIPIYNAGYIISNYLADFLRSMEAYGWLVSMVLGGWFPLLVMTGTHYAIVPVGINNRMTMEYDSLNDLYFAIIGSAIAFAVAFVVSYVLYKDPKEEDNATEAVPEASAEKKTVSANAETVCAPVNGKAVSLKEVSDPTFGEEILGKGIAILPADGHVVSPINGTVVTIFETLHAIGLKSDDGVEVLIHIGLDTVKLKGKHFTARAKSGDKVTVGTPLVDFDVEKVKEEGAADNEKAEAEISWPENPIQIIVGANAGGGIDTAARLIAKYMEKELGQSMVVSNVAGGAGSIASNQVKDSKSDGYTMLMRKVQMCGLLYYDPGDYGAIPDGNQEGEKQYFGREGGCSGVFLLPYLSGIGGGRCAVLRGADICSQYAGTGFVKLY